jgi:hypothetical protein
MCYNVVKPSKFNFYILHLFNHRELLPRELQKKIIHICLQRYPSARYHLQRVNAFFEDLVQEISPPSIYIRPTLFPTVPHYLTWSDTWHELLKDGKIFMMFGYNYQPGDAVWYPHEQRKECACTKLQPLYMGPCAVLKKYNDLVYCGQLSKGGPITVLNHDKLKPYQGQHYPKWGKRAISIYRRKK